MTVITIGTMRILQMVMDYVASRDLTASQLAVLYDALQDAIERFDEELLYCNTDTEYAEYSDNEYAEYSDTEYAECYYKLL